MDNIAKVYSHTWELLEDIYKWADTRVGRQTILAQGDNMTDIDTDETVIGIVPENLRAIMAYGYWLRDRVSHEVYGDMVSRLVENKMDMSKGIGIKPEEERKMAEAATEVEMYKKIFWNELRHVLNYYAGNVGIRKGWIAVAKPDEEDEVEVKKQLNDAVKNSVASLRSKTND